MYYFLKFILRERETLLLLFLGLEIYTALSSQFFIVRSSSQNFRQNLDDLEFLPAI